MILPERKSRSMLLYVYVALFVIFLYLPVLLIPLFSFNSGTIAAFPLAGFTTRWYGQLLESPPLIQALRNSLTIGVCVALMATSLGVYGAWVVGRYRMPGSALVRGYIMLPIIAPLVVLAVALFMLVVWLRIGLSLFTVGFGHLILCLPFAFSIMMSRFEGFDDNLLKASRDLGEGRLNTFLRVVLPLSWPGIVSSLLLTFTVSFDEFVLSFFLSSTQATLPIYIWSQLRFPERLPVVLSLGSLILLLSFILVVTAELLRRDRSPGEV